MIDYSKLNNSWVCQVLLRTRIPLNSSKKWALPQQNIHKNYVEKCHKSLVNKVYLNYFTMGQIAQNYLSDDKKEANQAVTGNVAPYSSVGIFRPSNTEKKPFGTGPIFTQNSSSKMSSVDGVKAPKNINKIVENPDLNDLLGKLTGEIVALSNLDVSRRSPDDIQKIWNALYAINPSKYSFLAANDEKFHPQDIIPQPELKKRVSSIIRPELTTGSLRLVTPTEKPITPITPRVETASAPKERIKIPTKITPIPLTSTVPKNISQSNGESGFLKRIGEEIVTDNDTTLPININQALPQTPEIVITSPLSESTISAVEKSEPIHESPIETIMEIENTVIPSTENTQKLETSPKTEEVRKLIETITPFYGTNWARWATPTSHTSLNTNEVEQVIPPGLTVEKISTWRDSPEIQKISAFINDIANIESEKDLITKYIPSYVNPNNPSSWVSVSMFSTNEILNADEGVYGLMHDTRLEISSYLQQLGTIDEATDFAQPAQKYIANRLPNYQAYLSLNTKFTVHDYYEEVRKRIAEADKFAKK